MKTIVVMGQARSGTSMLTGLLHTMGIQIDHDHNPSPQNPKGGFEDKTIIEITTKIMQKDNIFEQVRRFRELCRSKTGTWGFKSALTHYVIDYLIPFLVNPQFVVIFRNPLKAAESWKVHMQDVYKSEVTLPYALQRTMESYTKLADAIAKHKNVPCLTTLETLKSKDNGSELERLAAFVGVEMTDELRQKINDFILIDYTTLEG